MDPSALHNAIDQTMIATVLQWNRCIFVARDALVSLTAELSVARLGTYAKLLQPGQ